MLDLGRDVATGAAVQAPLAMLNRHGLVAGATGTGKTKTVQVMAEQLSEAGVAVLVADVKGDLSGLAEPAEPGGAGERRAAENGTPWAPKGFPLVPLALGGIGPGVPVRAALGDFGASLLAKVLRANETQEQTLALLFRWADEQGLALTDLDDLRALLEHVAKDPPPGVAKATVGVLLRGIGGLEPAFFGEPQLDVADLLRPGAISCVELPAVQDRPELWSTALLWLVAELFETLPEAGDLPQPKLVVFLDEAHLLFDEATKAFVDGVERLVRLIRSKGVGVFFVTQQPQDLPEGVLAQLGTWVQHALRARTPRDAKALRATVELLPASDAFDVAAALPALGIGEALVTTLDERGVPTPVVHARLPGPRSRMDPAGDLDALARGGDLWAKYGARLDRESAAEVLAARMEAAEAGPAPAEVPTPSPLERIPVPELPPAPAPRRRRAPASTGDLGGYLRSREGQRLQREVVRGVFGMLRKRL
jgi:uncharacterized protein